MSEVEVAISETRSLRQGVELLAERRILTLTYNLRFSVIMRVPWETKWRDIDILSTTWIRINRVYKPPLHSSRRENTTSTLKVPPIYPLLRRQIFPNSSIRTRRPSRRKWSKLRRNTLSPPTKHLPNELSRTRSLARHLHLGGNQGSSRPPQMILRSLDSLLHSIRNYRLSSQLDSWTLSLSWTWPRQCPIGSTPSLWDHTSIFFVKSEGSPSKEEKRTSENMKTSATISEI